MGPGSSPISLVKAKRTPVLSHAADLQPTWRDGAAWINDGKHAHSFRLPDAVSQRRRNRPIEPPLFRLQPIARFYGLSRGTRAKPSSPVPPRQTSCLHALLPGTHEEIVLNPSRMNTLMWWGHGHGGDDHLFFWCKVSSSSCTIIFLKKYPGRQSCGAAAPESR